MLCRAICPPISYFSFPDVVVSYSYCSGSNVWAAEGMLPPLYSTIDVETEKSCENGFHFTISCWFIPGSLAKSFTPGGTLKQAPYCRMRSDMWFDHFNKGLVQCRSAQGDRAAGGGPKVDMCCDILWHRHLQVGNCEKPRGKMFTIAGHKVRRFLHEGMMRLPGADNSVTATNIGTFGRCVRIVCIISVRFNLFPLKEQTFSNMASESMNVRRNLAFWQKSQWLIIISLIKNVGFSGNTTHTSFQTHAQIKLLWERSWTS